MYPSVSLVWYAFVLVQRSRDGNFSMKRPNRVPHVCRAQDQDTDASSSSTTSTVSPRIKTRIPILQYHDAWVCVNKPPGMSIHKTKNIPPSQQVLTSILKRQLARKVYPVHRLDHRTSGALLLAFTPEMCASLHRCLRWIEEDDDEPENEDRDDVDDDIQSNHTLSMSDSARKEYIALVRGDWSWKFKSNEIVTISKPLLIQGVLKDAQTEFQCLASFSNPDIQPIWESGTDSKPKYPFNPTACSLLLCTPKTGRTHQIRRHAYSMGMPILGDYEHGDSKVNRWWREERGLNRLFLHCLSLNLPPINHLKLKDTTTSMSGVNTTTTRLECIAPLTPDLLQVLKREDMKDMWESAITKDSRLIKDFVDEKGGSFGRNFKRKE